MAPCVTCSCSHSLPLLKPALIVAYIIKIVNPPGIIASMKDKPLLILGGATGSGKTALAIRLAKQYPKLVILSADSRQIYKKLDIGSAKVGMPGFEFALTGKPEPVWYEEGVPQYLIDIAEPNTTFTLMQYQQEAYRLMESIWASGKIPFLVGGTGLYLRAVAEGYLPSGGINETLRAELENFSLSELRHRLEQLGGHIVSTDAENKRRLIRAVERWSEGVKEPANRPVADAVYTFILDHSWEDQRSRAPAMVQERLDLGLVAEVEQLLTQGVDPEWLHGMGLSYRLVLAMLAGQFLPSDLSERMIVSFRHLMRKQRTWFKFMPGAELMNEQAIEIAIARLLKK